MAYPDRLMAWVIYPLCLGEMGLELRFKRKPNLFNEGCYELYDMHSVSLPIKMMMGAPRVVYTHREVIQWPEGKELKIGDEIEVVEVLDKLDGKVKYYGDLPNGDSWILPLKAIPKNIR